MIRADFLPHTEQVLFTKPGGFGTVRAVSVNCSDLMRAQLQDLPSKRERILDILEH